MKTLSFPPYLKRIASSQGISRILSAFGAGRFPLEIEAAEGSLIAFLLAALFKAETGPFLVVVPTELDGRILERDLETAGCRARFFPWWGMPYRETAPVSAVFGERTKVLCSLAVGAPDLIITPQRSLLTPLPPPDYLRSRIVTVKTGGAIDTGALQGLLVSYGYTRVPKVQVHGEFALRGEVLDILMGGDDKAYRILFDFDKVESIKRFDPIDQSGQEKVSEILIRPGKEVIWTDERIDALSENLAAFEEFPTGGRAILESLMSKGASVGEELLFPFAFREGRRKGAPYFTPFTLTDYLGPGATAFFLDWERLTNAQEILNREYQSVYRKIRRAVQGDAGGNTDYLQEIPVPERILLNFEELARDLDRRVSFLNLKSTAGEDTPRISAQCDPPRSFFGNINYVKEEFGALLQQGWEIVIAAESDVQAGRITELLRDLDGPRPPAQQGGKTPDGRTLPRRPARQETQPPASGLSVQAVPVSAGFALPDIKLMLVGESELFGRRKHSPPSLKTVRSAAIDTFVELNPGDYVVHINYGIGLFKGIERIKALGHERDYIKLEYLGEEIVFVPIEQVNLVQRYIGNEGAPPRLDKLGSKSWESRKSRVKKSVEDIAESLLVLYSKRKRAQGFAYPQDTEWQTMFEAAFPFEETEDQIRCIEEIKEDMESPHPMDRLVCGDVGFGKTEVAVRACFKAIMGGKQAAFLAPTTILADQHYENFLERFKQFPVRIAMLSRLVERKKIKQTLEQLQRGEIDLLVGTHRIIQKDVVFKDLGLMVIDEEQRFGVKDKERLKEMKTNIDCLTLSATPIPRTLHMSLLKIRDMSLLATPPHNRLPIETVIEEFNDDRLTAAIRREALRGGQVFFLHNRIESLQDIRVKIERLTPEMLVETAHGQMDAQDLEDVMHRFIHGGFHVLVSTTIIENGIDIPNVNTIIIDHADMYGVSQLYQLRGRVGRSDRTAYAYLFYSKDKALTEIAMKRLQVISDFTELGSGFKIAMKDMEIRGAGNLLGREQSGDIYSVGFDLYLHLLDEAVKRLEDENYEGENETLLELEYSGFIPDSYIDSAQEKMEVYKKIASVKTRREMEHVHAELIDRFGPLPDEAASLLALAEIRIICREISVASLIERAGSVRVEFRKVSKLKINALMRLIKESAGRVKLDPHAPHVLILAAGNIGLQEKSEFIREKLAALAG
ncbi:MAG: transcription-repair coupling factor [Treponema sp.]|jgi:transcription-repair coupling factor (superfamily II helicase)|nr:transcription-repair coupling factor [Treponema sp.]